MFPFIWIHLNFPSEEEQEEEEAVEEEEEEYGGGGSEKWLVVVYDPKNESWLCWLDMPSAAAPFCHNYVH